MISRTLSHLSEVVPFWAWPTVLSLDAPLVAVVWQAFFAASFDLVLTPAQRVLLAVAVWLVYAADRLLDACQLGGQHTPRTWRHHFYRDHARSIFTGWCAVLAASLVLAFAVLTPVELELGFGLAALALCYLLFVHLLPGQLLRVPKELQIGLLFALGVAVFLVPFPLTDLIPLLLFGLLCFLNCAWIAVWEQALDKAQGQASLAQTVKRLEPRLTRSTLLFGAVCLSLAVFHFAPLYFALALSAFLLFGLKQRAPRLGTELLRVLADVALLSPLLFLWLV